MRGWQIARAALLAATLVPMVALAPMSSAEAGDSSAALGTSARVPAAVADADWHPTRSKGGPIRKCYRVSCAVEIHTFSGDRLQWSHYAINPSGNRWYRARYLVGGTFPRAGWIWCGNVTAGC